MKRVLIVEDQADIRKLIRMTLEFEPYEIHEAANGTEGLAQAIAVQPDLILLDVMMPGMDGLEVCRRIRARGNVPILMLTARGDETDRVVGLELGADDYLAKPFDFPELVARVRALGPRACIRKSRQCGGRCFMERTPAVRVRSGARTPLKVGSFFLVKAGLPASARAPSTRR